MLLFSEMLALTINLSSYVGETEMYHELNKRVEEAKAILEHIFNQPYALMLCFNSKIL